jgi:hypothetical protein
LAALEIPLGHQDFPVIYWEVAFGIVCHTKAPNKESCYRFALRDNLRLSFLSDIFTASWMILPG